jgi:transcriptional regulator with XRE-family HTH domain
VTASPNVSKQLGDNLRRLRDAAAMSQERLSLSSGVEARSISKLERGLSDPQLSTMVRLARGLGVGLDELLQGIRPPV